MMTIFNALSPLVAFGAADAPPVDAEALSRRYAQVQVTSGVCEWLGYDVDREGIAALGKSARIGLVQDTGSAQDVQEHMDRDLRRQQNRFHRQYGDFLIETANWPKALIYNSAQQGDFSFRTTKQCDALAQSSDAGAFISAPQQPLGHAEVYKRIHASMVAAQGR